MSEVACERLLKADQIMWTTISLVMVIGTFMLWTMTLVVILMSEEEVEVRVSLKNLVASLKLADRFARRRSSSGAMSGTRHGAS